MSRVQQAARRRLWEAVLQQPSLLQPLLLDRPRADVRARATCSLGRRNLSHPMPATAPHKATAELQDKWMHSQTCNSRALRAFVPAGSYNAAQGRALWANPICRLFSRLALLGPSPAGVLLRTICQQSWRQHSLHSSSQPGRRGSPGTSQPHCSSSGRQHLHIPPQRAVCCSCTLQLPASARMPRPLPSM